MMRCEEKGTILDLLRARAERDPEAVAIRAPGRSPLTYSGCLSTLMAWLNF